LNASIAIRPLKLYAGESGLELSLVLGLAIVLHPVVVAFAPPANVQGGSVYRPWSGVQGFPYSSGNCGPISSDVNNTYMCKIDMFIFFTNLCFIYIAAIPNWPVGLLAYWGWLPMHEVIFIIN
jgi:hypothetical protein